MEVPQEAHRKLTDQEFEARFADASLNPEWFSHEAHLRLAWIHLRQYGETAAIEHICAQLKAFVGKIGASDKYHETLTIAAIKAVRHFVQKSPVEQFSEFMKMNPRLKTHFREIMAQHYSIDLVSSDLARKKYLEPDLLAFD